MKKKNNKKFLLVIAVVLVMVFAVFWIFSKNGSKEEVVECTIEAKDSMAVYEIRQKVGYVSGVFDSIETEYKVDILNSELKKEINLIKEEFEKKMASSFELESFKYTLNIENGILVLNYFLNAEDYNKFEESEAVKVIDSQNAYDFYVDKDEFISKMKKLGGECTYE